MDHEIMRSFKVQPDDWLIESKAFRVHLHIADMQRLYIVDVGLAKKLYRHLVSTFENS